MIRFFTTLSFRKVITALSIAAVFISLILADQKALAALLVIVVAAVVAPDLSRRFSTLIAVFAYTIRQTSENDLEPCMEGLMITAERGFTRHLQYLRSSHSDTEDCSQTLAEKTNIRMQSKRELREIEERYKLMLELSSEAIMFIDRKGNILDASGSFYDCLGYSPEEVIGINLLNLPFLSEESIDKLIENISQRIAGANPYPCELCFITKSSEKRFGRAVTDSMRNEKGEIVQGIIIISDITGHKKTEELLQEREAQAYAQGRLEILDTILHNIGNAINSINIGIGTIQENLVNGRLNRRLTSLANAVKEHQHDFSSYVKNDPQGQQVAPFIIALADDFVKHNAELAKTVSRVSERSAYITDIARMEKTSGTKYVYSKAINLEKTINYAIDVLRKPIRKRGIHVIVDCNDAPREISTQETQFHQMLTSLVKNSIEAIDDLKKQDFSGYKPFIRVNCYARSDALVIEVTDNGIGVEKGKLEAIFRSGHTKTNSESGIGLHSAANFVNRYGGSIQALSDGIGKGRTIRMILPLSPITLCTS